MLQMHIRKFHNFTFGRYFRSLERPDINELLVDLLNPVGLVEDADEPVTFASRIMPAILIKRGFRPTLVGRFITNRIN